MKRVYTHTQLADRIHREQGNLDYQRKIKILLFCNGQPRPTASIREHLEVSKSILSRLLSNIRAEGLIGSSPVPTGGPNIAIHQTTNFGVIYLREKGLIE